MISQKQNTWHKEQLFLSSNIKQNKTRRLEICKLYEHSRVCTDTFYYATQCIQNVHVLYVPQHVCSNLCIAGIYVQLYLVQVKEYYHIDVISVEIINRSQYKNKFLFGEQKTYFVVIGYPLCENKIFVLIQEGEQQLCTNETRSVMLVLHVLQPYNPSIYIAKTYFSIALYVQKQRQIQQFLFEYQNCISYSSVYLIVLQR